MIAGANTYKIRVADESLHILTQSSIWTVAMMNCFFYNPLKNTCIRKNIFRYLQTL